jgi:hypothetical protein
LHTFLEIDDIKSNEQFEIVREKENSIDLLFKSDKHIIVLENKIDSDINGVSKIPNTNGKYKSQLSKYYDYIEKKYKNYIKKFFVLSPEYSSISSKKLDSYYERGNEYTLKHYSDLYEKVLDKFEYKPLGIDPSDESKFFFNQFKQSIQYLTWSSAKQKEHIAYIRLKQRIRELDEKKKTITRQNDSDTLFGT